MIYWVATAPNPRSRDRSADAGQKGWRLHAVDEADETIEGYAKRGKHKAKCGLRPRHGWSLDMFIDEPCARCFKKVESDEGAMKALDKVLKDL